MRESSRGDATAAALMTAPAALGLLAFVAVPFLLAIGISLTNLRLGSPLPTEWVGLEQYRRLFADPTFRRALLNNAYFAAVIVPVQTALALGAAVVVNERFPGRTWVRTALFVPVVFPMAMVAVAWELLYAPGPGGALNSWLDALTLGLWEPRDWLRDPVLAMPSLMALSVWQGMGLQMVILLAGLQQVPESLYESARLDGAGPWSRFRHVTLPQLRNPLVFVIVITAILAFRIFDQVQILTRGGPDDATTTVMFAAVTAAFTRQQVALASAMSVVFFIAVLSITWLGRRAFRKEPSRA
ncbi:MAG TPA: sugar ABC transporter permease [Longimicrobiales bacterium]|nr:sugar ABC transporter permease [Longimicrobiales bacterium]